MCRTSQRQHTSTSVRKRRYPAARSCRDERRGLPQNRHPSGLGESVGPVARLGRIIVVAASPYWVRAFRFAQHLQRAVEPRGRPDGRHSISPSANPVSEGGIVNPKLRAVLRLMMNSNLLGCSTGRSAGFAPFMILST
jgi:hypothetical protein